MPAPKNHLKAALAAKTPQFGLWLNLASAYSAEALAGAGFDWLLIDGEHGPNAIPDMLAQAQTIGTRTNVVVRPPVGEVRMIKQILDLGVQTILVPMIESAEHAAEMVRAMLYPPAGIRGVGAAVARASDFGRITDYLTTANAETCLLLQLESRAGLAALPAILEMEGVDGVFIGPADLSASMGHAGNQTHPEVKAAIEDAFRRILAANVHIDVLLETLEWTRHAIVGKLEFLLRYEYESRRKTYGEFHREAIESAVRLGEVLEKLEKYKEAKLLYSNIIPIIEAELEGSHDFSSSSFSQACSFLERNLIPLMRKIGESKEAEILLNRISEYQRECMSVFLGIENLQEAKELKPEEGNTP